MFGQHKEIIPDGFIRIKPFAVDPDFQKNVLGDIIGRERILEDTTDECMEGRIIAMEKFFIGLDLSSDKPREQRLLFGSRMNKKSVRIVFHKVTVSSKPQIIKMQQR